MAFILLLMMALVSSGNAVSVGHTSKHDHFMTEAAKKSRLSDAAQLSGVNDNAKTSKAVSIKSDSESVTASHELASAHCQHHDMSPLNAHFVAKNAEASKSTERHTSNMRGVASHSGHSGEMTDMSCCMDECNCPADHCFNLSATALIQPTVETEITVARMAAAALITGQLTSFHFGQFRPPKLLFTA
ncbi:MAG: hypothetical protein SVW51_05615 [Pseudomonadota bacterium]|nr:hypothetical protein [Pseudomonadota bacterium]